MSIRHYMSVDEPKDNLTYHKIKKYILKPLMFPLRMERYCSCGYFPLKIDDLYKAYDDKRLLIEYFLNQEKYEEDIKNNHRKLLEKMQNLISIML